MQRTRDGKGLKKKSLIQHAYNSKNNLHLKKYIDIYYVAHQAAVGVLPRTRANAAFNSCGVMRRLLELEVFEIRLASRATSPKRTRLGQPGWSVWSALLAPGTTSGPWDSDSQTLERRACRTPPSCPSLPRSQPLNQCTFSQHIP